MLSLLGGRGLIDSLGSAEDPVVIDSEDETKEVPLAAFSVQARGGCHDHDGGSMVGDEVIPVREPDNRFDRNAILVTESGAERPTKGEASLREGNHPPLAATAAKERKGSNMGTTTRTEEEEEKVPERYAWIRPKEVVLPSQDDNDEEGGGMTTTTQTTGGDDDNDERKPNVLDSAGGAARRQRRKKPRPATPLMVRHGRKGETYAATALSFPRRRRIEDGYIGDNDWGFDDYDDGWVVEIKWSLRGHSDVVRCDACLAVLDAEDDEVGGSAMEGRMHECYGRRRQRLRRRLWPPPRQFVEEKKVEKKVRVVEVEGEGAGCGGGGVGTAKEEGGEGGGEGEGAVCGGGTVESPPRPSSSGTTSLPSATDDRGADSTAAAAAESETDEHSAAAAAATAAVSATADNAALCRAGPPPPSPPPPEIPTTTRYVHHGHANREKDDDDDGGGAVVVGEKVEDVEGKEKEEEAEVESLQHLEPGAVCRDYAFYSTYENDTPAIVSRKLGCAPTDLVAANLERFDPTLGPKSKFRAGTYLRIPTGRSDLDSLRQLCACCECGKLRLGRGGVRARGRRGPAAMAAAAARRGGTMLICEGCETACHLSCAPGGLSEVPDGDWYCASCERDGGKMMGTTRYVHHEHANEEKEDDDDAGEDVDSDGDHEDNEGEEAEEEAEVESLRHLEPGAVWSYAYYSTYENETPVTVSRKLGCDLTDLVAANLERYGPLVPRSKFRAGTYLRIPTDRSDPDSLMQLCACCECGRLRLGRGGGRGRRRRGPAAMAAAAAAGRGGTMLFCEGCKAACHLSCARGGLSEVPDRDWYCSFCEDGGKMMGAVAANVVRQYQATHGTDESAAASAAAGAATISGLHSQSPSPPHPTSSASRRPRSNNRKRPAPFVARVDEENFVTRMRKRQRTKTPRNEAPPQDTTTGEPASRELRPSFSGSGSDSSSGSDSDSDAEDGGSDSEGGGSESGGSEDLVVRKRTRTPWSAASLPSSCCAISLMSETSETASEDPAPATSSAAVPPRAVHNLCDSRRAAAAGGNHPAERTTNASRRVPQRGAIARRRDFWTSFSVVRGDAQSDAVGAGVVAQRLIEKGEVFHDHNVRFGRGRPPPDLDMERGDGALLGRGRGYVDLRHSLVEWFNEPRGGQSANIEWSLGWSDQWVGGGVMSEGDSTPQVIKLKAIRDIQSGEECLLIYNKIK